MNRTYAYLRNDRKIKFRMVSAQHFINEALVTDPLVRLAAQSDGGEGSGVGR